MLNLLIVDDEATTRECLTEMIDWNAMGITGIRIASNGLSALEVVSTYTPDILISDVRMPKMNGIELAKAIRSIFEQCKFVFISGYLDTEYLKSAIQLRVYDYIEKPLNIENVKAVLKIVVGEIYKERRWDCTCADTLRAMEKGSPVLEAMHTDRKLSEIVAYIGGHYSDKKLSLRSISANVYLSQSYLCAYFKRVTGLTINEFISLFRVEKAKESLVQNRIKLYEVARSIGLSDVNYFCTFFKKYVGQTPSEYQNGMRPGTGR